MANGTTEIVLILDRSGSMELIKDDMDGALQSFIEEQKKVEGRANVTFVRFDDEYEKVFENKPIEEVKAEDLKIEPRGTTALLDAVGKTINLIRAHLIRCSQEDKPDKVLVAIITDGQENSSSEFKCEQIKDMIKEQSDKYDWMFTYLGANQDAFKEAGAMGINKDAVLNYSATGGGTRSALNSMSSFTTRYRSCDGKMNNKYSDEDREKAKD